MKTDALVEKLRNLPPEKVHEVEDFVDFLAQRAQRQAVANAADSSGEAAKLALLQEIAEGMKANSFIGNPPHFTREELHNWDI